MRNIAITLLDTFGRQFNGEVNGYLSQQWVRMSSYKHCEFGLGDMDEPRLNSGLGKMIKHLGLSANEFLSGTMVRAYVDSKGTIAPLYGFKASLYESLISSVAKVDVSLLYKGDEIEYSGKNNHVAFSKKSNNRNGDSIGGFINGITKEGELFSLLINNEQWQEIIKSYDDIKCNGTLFVDKEWQENIEKGFLFHRLIDEFIGSVLNDEDLPSYEKYRSLVDFEAAFYESDSTKSEVVLSKRGYKLGKTVKLFDDVDVLAAKKEEAKTRADTGRIKVVVDNSKAQKAAKKIQKKGANSATFFTDQLTEAETFSDWGDF